MWPVVLRSDKKLQNIEREGDYMSASIPSRTDVYVGFEAIRRNVDTMKGNWKELIYTSKDLTSLGAQLVLDKADQYDDLEFIESRLVSCEKTYFNYLELSSEFSGLLKSFNDLIALDDFRRFREHFYTECEELKDLTSQD